jgi:hypothetical protein
MESSMMRTVLTALSLIPPAALAAPAPAPKPLIPKEFEGLYLAAEASSEAAARIREEVLCFPPDDPGKVAKANKEMTRLHALAGERYARIVEGMRRKRGLVSTAGLDMVALKAGREFCSSGDASKALLVSEWISHESSSPETRVEAGGRCVCCLSVLGRQGDIPTRLVMIRKELPRLKDKEREEWGRWLDAAMKEK